MIYFACREGNLPDQRYGVHRTVAYEIFNCLGSRKIYICKVLAKILETFTNP